MKPREGRVADKEEEVHEDLKEEEVAAEGLPLEVEQHLSWKGARVTLVEALAGEDRATGPAVAWSAPRRTCTSLAPKTERSPSRSDAAMISASGESPISA